MKIKKGFEFFLIALMLITITSCGGNGGGIGSTGGGVGGSGVSKPITSKGTITKFGSVFVNGVEFETTGSVITMDDNPGTDDDLGLGMVVTVTGTINEDGTTGSADSIEFKDDLEGPITSTDPAGQTIIVLGQTVAWDSSTICENSSSASIDCAALAVNNLVEVSGFPTTSGAILATRIEIKDQIFDPADEVELKGTISGLTATTFLIGTQAVGYSSTTVFENVSISTLADGMFVEVKGNLATGVLDATRIKLEGEGLDVGEDQDVRIEGLVTVFTSCNGSDCTFEVNGQHVQTSSATEFKNGIPSDISVGVRLEVEGTIDANGVLVASEISFHNERVEIEAEVQSVDLTSNSVMLLGITVTATALTEFDDNSSSHKEPFGLADINEGDFLRIRGHLDNGSVIADRIERRDPESNVLLQGPVDSVSNPNLVILGVEVQTNSQTQFEDTSENLIGQADFFGQVQSGTQVKAKGVFAGGAIAADEVGIVD
ncbi:MAG: hypothetical protein HZA13_04320 [Nitrospirae bacterium]|nr:hypothetical protein [Nitrospirota bacterium]